MQPQIPMGQICPPRPTSELRQRFTSLPKRLGIVVNDTVPKRHLKFIMSCKRPPLADSVKTFIDAPAAINCLYPLWIWRRQDPKLVKLAFQLFHAAQLILFAQLIPHIIENSR